MMDRWKGGEEDPDYVTLAIFAPIMTSVTGLTPCSGWKPPERASAPEPERQGEMELRGFWDPNPKPRA